MGEQSRSKIAGPLQRKVTANEGAQSQTEEEVKLYIEAEPGQVAKAKRAIEGLDIDILSEQVGYIGANVAASKVRQVAELDSVRHIQERRPPKQYSVEPKNVSEGVEIVSSDALVDEGITGDGARIAVIDHTFHTENPKYEENIVATVGPDEHFTDNEEYEEGSQHGTACAEIVADIAPDAELILATALDQPFEQVMDEIESYNPDAATMSLGFDTSLRIDGQDPISSRVDEFTNGNRLFAVAAGNEADGSHWDGEFENDGNDLMVFDESLSEPTRYPVVMDPVFRSAEVHIHWDADWEQDDQWYIARLYDDEHATEPIDGSFTNNPVEILELTPEENSNPGTPEWYFVEIEKDDATGNEHFDMFHWGRAAFDSDFTTPERSLGIPATSPDVDTISVAAVQATDDDASPNDLNREEAEHLKTYSSRGPTQDGRRGLDIAGPSMVSGTDVDEHGGYGALEDGGGFNGTSAAAPHVGGALGLLFDSAIDFEHDEVRTALYETGRPIVDSDVSEPSDENTELGFGYFDAQAAFETLTETTLEVTGDTVSTDESAELTIDAEYVHTVTVEKLWIDWDVAGDGGNWDTNTGVLEYSWGETQGSVNLSPTITPNGQYGSGDTKYVGGEYLLTITAEGPEDVAQTTTTIQLTE